MKRNKPKQMKKKNDLRVHWDKDLLGNCFGDSRGHVESCWGQNDVKIEREGCRVGLFGIEGVLEVHKKRGTLALYVASENFVQ